MDESFQDLENELKALRPRRPSVLLRAQIERELGAAAPTDVAAPAPARRYTTASTFRTWKWAGWQLAAAAVVVALLSLAAVLRPGRPAPEAAAPAAVVAHAQPIEPRRDEPLVAAAPAPARDVYRPVKAANVLYDLQDEGLVLLDDNTPARRVRARYVDTYTWKNPATNASLRWSVPRDEVRVLPTSFH
jgi:hypothetical protein